MNTATINEKKTMTEACSNNHATFLFKSNATFNEATNKLYKQQQGKCVTYGWEDLATRGKWTPTGSEIALNDVFCMYDIITDWRGRPDALADYHSDIFTNKWQQTHTYN